MATFLGSLEESIAILYNFSSIKSAFMMPIISESNLIFFPTGSLGQQIRILLAPRIFSAAWQPKKLLFKKKKLFFLSQSLPI